jgi:Transposase DDE domain
VNLTLLAACLQALFTTRADELASAANFLQRRSKLTGSTFLRALASVWGRHPAASYERLALPLGISRQSLFNRFTPRATAFCRCALLEALNHSFQADPQALPLLDRFRGVFLDDCTQLPLPDACAAEFAGCGSGVCDLGKAGMKTFTRFEIQSGCIRHLSIHPARTADAKAAASAPDLPGGSLNLADLGFADFAQMQRQTDQGVYRLSRLPAQTSVRLADGGENRPLVDLLREWRQRGEVEVDLEGVQVGNKEKATGRLTVLACPADVARERLRKANENAKRRGRQLSERQQEMCRWQVLFSNVPVAWLSALQSWRVYRLRWQIELLFKRFKSHGGMQKSSSEKPERVKCEWYVKLLIQVAKNWLRLTRGGPLLGVNQALLGQVVGDFCGKVFEAIDRGVAAVRRVLRELQGQLRKLRPRTRRRARPTASQWLTDASSLD